MGFIISVKREEKKMSIYDRLITFKRLRPTTRLGRDLPTEMLSDKGRILLSSAFRRLQIKAQVFSLEKNAAIRSRLTHTLEVAFYGELIANKVFSRLKDVAPELRQPFITVVQNACLLHDIGNPPFGHLGEFAIRDWFKRKEDKIKNIWKKTINDEELINVYLNGLINFDGNAQGFRIVSRLQWLKDEYGLNLTATLLASMVKYLSSSQTTDEKGPFTNKIGFFETEKDLVGEVWKALGMNVTENKLPAYRHPLTFIMEAADDIAYTVNDIEDAIEKKVVSMDDFFRDLEKELPEAKAIHDKLEDSENNSKYSRYTDFRLSLTYKLVEDAANIFVENESDILAGKFHTGLLKAENNNHNSRLILKFLQNYAGNYIYTSREAIDIELSGYKIIQKVLDRLSNLIEMDAGDFSKLINKQKLNYGAHALERRLVSLLPNKHVLNYKFMSRSNPELEIVYRTHLMVDYLSGMTDSHAVKVYDILSGITTSATI